jgi:intein/homing endonuclease
VQFTSCFAAGTVVSTETGAQPIETIRAGDRVLSQNADTGELNYQTVLATTIRPPAPLVVIRADGEKIRATRGHPFWVSGHGWKMAKFLTAGDNLHCANGLAVIESIGEVPPERSYNLVVDEFATYFVGDQRLLVHDNTMRKPTQAIVPGLSR